MPPPQTNALHTGALKLLFTAKEGEAKSALTLGDRETPWTALFSSLAEKARPKHWQHLKRRNNMRKNSIFPPGKPRAAVFLTSP